VTKAGEESMMSTVTIRVPGPVHTKLQQLSSAEGRPIGQVIDELLELYERDRFFKELAEDFQRLRADPVASAEYDAEMAAWDTTLLDGLDDLPYDESQTEESEK
jgi:hypothetical protein